MFLCYQEYPNGSSGTLKLTGKKKKKKKRRREEGGERHVMKEGKV